MRHTHNIVPSCPPKSFIQIVIVDIPSFTVRWTAVVQLLNQRRATPNIFPFTWLLPIYRVNVQNPLEPLRDGRRFSRCVHSAQMKIKNATKCFGMESHGGKDCSRILDQNLWRWAEVFRKSRQKHLPMPHLLSISISISLDGVILKDDMLKNLWRSSKR